jgi:small basic protein (TIGR04137 family)
MSLDRSLKTAGGLARHRNVLTRAERLVALKSADKFKEGQSVFNLPKVANRKLAAGKKTAKTEDAAAAPAAAPAKGGKAAAPAAGAKAAAPAAGAKAPAAAAKPAAKK